MTTTEQHEAPIPVLRKTPSGWLATSPEGARFRLGAQAATEDECAALYAAEYAKFVELAARPYPRPDPDA